MHCLILCILGAEQEINISKNRLLSLTIISIFSACSLRFFSLRLLRFFAAAFFLFSRFSFSASSSSKRLCALRNAACSRAFFACDNEGEREGREGGGREEGREGEREGEECREEGRGRNGEGEREREGKREGKSEMRSSHVMFMTKDDIGTWMSGKFSRGISFLTPSDSAHKVGLA